MDKQIYLDFIGSPIGYWTIKADDQNILSIGYSKTKPTFDCVENEWTDSAKTQLEGYFKHSLKEFDLPLCVHPYSAFYQQVWEKLIKVPYGKTNTYLDLAKALKNPKAVRAVGLANGRNPFSIVIPCHRIIGSDNSLTGYASGLDVKRWLLEHEGAIGKQTRLFD